MNGDEFYDKVAKTLHRTTDEVRERFEQAHTGIVCVGIYCRKCGDLKEWRYFGGPSWGGSAGDEVEKEKFVRRHANCPIPRPPKGSDHDIAFNPPGAT